jgi:hypothetical protein
MGRRKEHRGDGFRGERRRERPRSQKKEEEKQKCE